MKRNLETLIEKIRDFTNRGNEMLSDDVIETFISLAETKLYRKLRTPANEAVDEWTALSDGGDLTISPNYIEFRLIMRNGVPTEQLTLRECSNGKKGYARMGGKIHFNPTYSEGELIKLFYYKDLSGMLIASNDSNAILEASFNVYLYGGLAEAFRYQQEQEMALTYDMKCDEEIENMNTMARQAELSGGKLEMAGSPYSYTQTNKY